MSEKKQVKLLFPLTWMEPWEMGDEMFHIYIYTYIYIYICIYI